MAKDKPIRTLKIGNFDIQAIRWPLDGRFGEYDPDKQEIHIDSEAKNQKIIDGTIFHEACHGAFNTAGLSELLGEKLEEACCRCLENMLWPNLSWKYKQ